MMEFRMNIDDLQGALHVGPLNQFFSLNADDSLFCFKWQPLIDPQQLTTKPNTATYSSFDMFLLESVGVLSAYLFKTTNKVQLFPKYVKIIRPSSLQLQAFKGVKLIMQDDRLNVFHSEDGATLVTLSNLKSIIKPSFVRRSEKTEREDE